MWVLVLLLAIGAGWQIVRRLPLKWRRLEAAAASVAIGFVVASWVYFLCAWVFGWTWGFWLAAVILAGGQIVLQLRRTKPYVSLEPWRRRGFNTLALWAIATAVAIWLSWLMVLSYNFPTGGDWFSNGNVWGDGPLHVGFVTMFAHGSTLSLASPVYEKVPLTYPFLPDFWSGVLMWAGSNWQATLVVPSVLMLLALLVLLFNAGRRLLNSELGGWLAWYMVVFSGSIQGALRVTNLMLHSSKAAFMSALQYSFLSTTGDTYLNFFNAQLFPQRSYLFGMPMLIVVSMVALDLWRERANHTSRRQRQIAGAVAGVLLGLMPLVHTHSFFVAAGVLALASAAIWWHGRHQDEHQGEGHRPRFNWPAGWLAMLGIGAVLAAPQVYFQFTTTFHTGFSHWIFGWVVENYGPSHRNWLVFWLANTGWLTVMILAGWWWLYRGRAKAEVWLVYAAGASIFLACNVYVFQPSIWDNMKFFGLGFWFIMLVTAAVMVRWCRHIWGRVVTAGLMVSLCTMGVYTLILAAPHQNYELLSASDVRFGDHMRQALPANAYVLVTDQHNDPITMLADRDVLMTYAGWYNLYAGDWPTTLANRTTMLAGGPDAMGLMRSYGLNFAVFSDTDVASGTANLTFFQQHFRVFDYEAGWWVFDLRQAR